MRTQLPQVRILGLLLGGLLCASASAQALTARSNAPASVGAMVAAPSDPTAAADITADTAGADASPPAFDRSRRYRHRGEDLAAMPWSSLSADQRGVLAPLQSQWDRFPPQRQQRMAEHAQDWAKLPPDRRQLINDRLQRWAQMTPEQRQAAARGARRFRQMSDADRQRLKDTYRRFQSMPPEQRRALMQQWREQHAKEHQTGEPPAN